MWNDDNMRDDEAPSALPFEEFAAQVGVTTGQAAAAMRARYIARFIDTTSAFFREHIAHLEQHSDGLAYEGYLWDCLASGHPIPIKEDDLNNAVAPDQSVSVIWDLHSRDKIWTPGGDYWRFPKDAVLTLAYRTLLDGLAYLPTDLYVFTPDMSWTIILTHETDLDGHRLIYRSP